MPAVAPREIHGFLPAVGYSKVRFAYRGRAWHVGIFSAFVHGAKEGVKEGLTGRSAETAVPRAQADRRGVVLEPVAAWTKGAWPQLDVVGEHFHREELVSLASAARGGSPDDIDVVASLVAQPENAHDPYACAVYVGQGLIGYLSRENAREYQPMLVQLQSRGQELTAICHVHYYSTFDEVSEAFTIEAQARLELDKPWLCLPANEPPTTPYALLPYGSAIQVRKEEEHMDVLRSHLNDRGEGWAWATLHEIESTGRSPRPIVEVRIDEARVGDLTLAMSDHFLSTIRALDAVGKQCAIKALVKGNALKAEVTLHGCKTHELPNAWITQNVVPVVGGPASAVRNPAAPFEPDAASASLDSGPSASHLGVRHAAPAVSGAELNGLRFNPAPGWPEPPPGWTPPPGWQPAPDWPTPPIGWQFWV